jgi:hypothetical protein
MNSILFQSLRRNKLTQSYESYFNSKIKRFKTISGGASLSVPHQINLNSSTKDVLIWLQSKEFDVSAFKKWDGAAILGADKEVLIKKLGIDEGERMIAMISGLNKLTGI